MVDGRGSTSAYGYDALGRMATITDALGNTTTYGYNALGQRTSQSRRGTGSQTDLVTWAYDAAGRMASRAASGQATIYTYDDAGNQTTASTTGSTISTTFDRLNRPLTVTVSGDSAATTSYSYSLTSPSWTDPSGSYAATLDKFDRQVALTDPVHGTSQFTLAYRADGQPATLAAPNGNTTMHGYDDAGAPSSKVTANSGGTLASYSWTRNRAGQILSESSTISSDPTNGTTTYAYDSLSRIASFTRAGSTTAYGWQAVPNRKSVQVDAQTPDTYTFDVANRETTSSLGNIDYDAEGRLTMRPGQSLEWDDIGRLSRVRNSSNTTIASFTYDALDRLLTVEHPSIDHIRFRYVGLSTAVAQVAEDATGNSIRSFANDLSGERLFDWVGTGSDQHFYGTNGHHDVTWTANDTGVVSSTLRYDPWGNLAASTGSYLPVFRFQGSWFDPVAELSWAVARWYSPRLGRFASEDSLFGEPSQPPSRHLYSYGEGQPVSRGDPFGMYPVDDGPRRTPFGHWMLTRAGDTPTSLATELLGSRSKWPIIYNHNRRVFTWPTSHNSGACFFVVIPDSKANRPSCGPGRPTGNDIWWARDAADTLGVNWWTLTQWDLEALTESETHYRNDGNRKTYLDNLAYFSTGGIALASLGGKWRAHEYHLSVWGNPLLPPGTNRAFTAGSVIFYRSYGDSWDLPLISHEYVHQMQYAANRDYIGQYETEKKRVGATDWTHRLEAIGHLWEAWAVNYQGYGGPFRYPWQVWKIPTWDDVDHYRVLHY